MGLTFDTNGRVLCFMCKKVLDSSNMDVANWPEEDVAVCPTCKAEVINEHSTLH